MKPFINTLILCCFSLIVFTQEFQPNPKTPFDPKVFNEGITSISLFSRAACSRCPVVKQYLNEKGISYVEFDAGEKEIYQYIDNRVSESLPEPGMGYSICYPVIEINKKIIYYKIPNYVEFVDALSDFLENQNKKD